MTAEQQPVIAFIGGGNMAEAILGGLYRFYPHSLLRFSEPLDERREYMSQKYPDVWSTNDNQEVVQGADMIILAVKPQVLRPVVQGVANVLRQSRPLVISIAAGIETAAIVRWLGADDIPVVRIMPNTPALIGEGAVGLFATTIVTQEQRQLTEQLMGAISKQLSWVKDESLIDTITGVSGSGPAYFFLIMEAMENAGVAAGLSREDAKALTLQTCLGAACMAQTSEDDLATLRRKVTSPKGTTEAAILSMEANRIREVIHDAVFAATNRSRELAQELCKD
ncbi:hypothetical protein G6F70_001553 [Rhizopus microsporus]|uniref:Pyrroline-5-carboxylate reductase n=2 Tax=Rhizopus TaxID=4842 RepID=A0A367JCB8_RHIAZ|nr:hypothetical protein G6F71_001822 [Rhizopus microsporus]RCH87546.1 hypothetical protein CU097_003215 [Rhizopus azygosporus]KAG1203255.1 hypothetical protein G6F70_001553 [Rhizopus microsporus]KAG1216355.1 hypothetical protein G6F69_000117 [Rhizopus microsporus]KAG1238388.1 hypothetical protein G6F67_000475 [Rhizopus microsporus]